MKIVVIGSGFGGLSAAIRLQAQGHQVMIAEKRDKPGGRAYVYQQDGFTFDADPTIIKLITFPTTALFSKIDAMPMRQPKKRSRAIG
jgi:phytoene dehydrogenase-like protein